MMLLAASLPSGFSFCTARPALVPRAHSRPVLMEESGPSLFGRLRGKREVEQPKEITVGTPLPDIEIEAILFDVASEDGAEVPEEGATDVGIPTDIKAAVLPVAKALGNGTTVLVGMPGAFTPTCTDAHLPGFIKQSAALKAVGVERVGVLTTNDRYVNAAWNKAIEQCMATKSDLLMLSDADGDLVKEMGLVDDMGFGLGLRSKRFVIIAEDGVVRNVLTDAGSNELKSTSAEAVVKLLTPEPESPPAVADEVDPAAAATLGVLAVAGLLYYLSQSGTAF